MPDPHLHQLIHGLSELQSKNPNETHNLKNQFELALDIEIKSQVENLIKDEDPYKNKFLPIALRRVRLEEELRELISLSELGKHLASAVKIIKSDGHTHLNSEDFQALINEFETLHLKLSGLDVIDNNLNIQDIFTFTPQNQASILELAISKYREDHLSDCLSLFTLLTTINTQHPDYWYRLGLVSQKMENNELAIKAYEVALQLDPTLIGACIFTAQIFISLGLFHEASLLLTKAKKIMETSAADPEWQKQLLEINNQIQHSEFD